MTPELTRLAALTTIGTAPQVTTIDADAPERAALAARFALIALDALSATVTLVRSGDRLMAHGRVRARVVQACVVTGDPVAAAIDEAFSLRFVGHDAVDAAELELDADACDTLVHDGATVDLGEAVAQTLGLALEPFPRSAEIANDVEQRWRAGPDAGPFTGLRDLLAR